MTAPSDPPVKSSSRFRVFSRTDVGKRRQRNEDSLGVIARHGVFVVADGMGGVDGGDFCSRLVIDYMVKAFENLSPDEISYEETLDVVENTIIAASEEIKQEAGRRGICGMGTTVVAICYNLTSMDEACVMHVGDSRAYRYRNRMLTALTVDHSLAAESGIRDGDMVPMFMAGVITRAVGVKSDVLVDRTPVDVQRGDQFLLCSDGLYNMVPEGHMSMLLSRQSQDPAAEMVAAANEAGGFDNITVILIELLDGPEGEELGNLDETIA
jgi:protein phosphatase